MKEQLTQEENDIQDFDVIIDRLATSRNKTEVFKMVTSGFSVTGIANSSFLSVFPFPAEKWALHQEPLRDFFVGNPSPVCNNRPHSQVGFEASTNLFPQEKRYNSSIFGLTCCLQESSSSPSKYPF
jgi:hypothetical protein